MAAAVRALPTRQREVLVCRFYLELTETQTATVLEIGRTSVKTHERRGSGRVDPAAGGDAMSVDRVTGPGRADDLREGTWHDQQ